MTSRFYTPDLGETATLEGSEAHHLRNVLRLGLDDVVELFDGHGVRATARVTRIDKQAVALAVLQRFEDPASCQPTELVLATAVPKGDRFRSLVEKATELGVDRLIPLRTEHSVVHPRPGKQDRMQQAIIAACKQSGRNRLMTLDVLTDWADLVGNTEATLVLSQRGGQPATAVLAELRQQQPAQLVLCVGPEGGWSDAELDLARRAGITSVDLGPHVLRIETAAVTLSVLAHADYNSA